VETDITIALPVPPAVFAIFVGLIVVALIYYVTKFVLSIVTGG
jgi:hypothetical protein